ncbi:hypothetical protein ACWGK6_09940 [Streptomyces violaceusniger]|uniref:hypothetical protein n=1 Tax=Streptomyces violaceusniger TaxID=68280 RepID=UPI0037F25EE5
MAHVVGPAPATHVFPHERGTHRNRRAAPHARTTRYGRPAHRSLIDHCDQPTSLDSPTLGSTPADPWYPDIWRIRGQGVERVLDELDHIVAAVPDLDDRVDSERIAVAGHS